MLASLDDGSARATEGIGDETIVEANALLGYAVEVRGWGDVLEASTIGGNCLVGMVVGKDEYDVRAFLGGSDVWFVGVLRVGLRRVWSRFVGTSETKDKRQDKGKEAVFHANFI
jgi:hypothetical protein